MTRNDLSVIARTAALTMLVALPVMLPSGVSAGPDPIVELGLVEHSPALDTRGASVTVRLAKPSYKAGEPIELVATVSNPKAKPVHVVAKLQLVAVAYSSPMARMRAMPRQVWTQPLVVDLKAGETRELRFTAKVNLGNGASASVVAIAGDKQVILASAAIGERPADPTGLGVAGPGERNAPPVAPPSVAAPSDAPAAPADGATAPTTGAATAPAPTTGAATAPAPTTGAATAPAPTTGAADAPAPTTGAADATAAALPAVAHVER